MSAGEREDRLRSASTTAVAAAANTPPLPLPLLLLLLLPPLPLTSRMSSGSPSPLMRSMSWTAVDASALAPERMAASAPAAPARLSCRFVSTNAAHKSFFIFGFRWQYPRGRRWWSLQSGHQRRPSFTGGGFFSAFLDGRGFVGDFDMLRSRFVPDTAPTLAAAFNHARDCDTQGQATNGWNENRMKQAVNETGSKQCMRIECHLGCACGWWVGCYG